MAVSDEHVFSDETLDFFRKVSESQSSKCLIQQTLTAKEWCVVVSCLLEVGATVSSVSEDGGPNKNDLLGLAYHVRRNVAETLALS